MTPGGRLQAVIEVLDTVRMDNRPADRVLHEYFRERRFIGSRDRRAISTIFWKIMRNRARLAADCALADGRNPTDASVRNESGRRLVMALCVRERVPDEVDLALFDGVAYAPAPVGPKDKAWVQALRRVKPSERPEWAWAETPQWLWQRFQELFGDKLEAEVSAAREEGSVDLRVNTLRADLPTARAQLLKDGIETEAMRYAPLGLRVVGRANVAATKTFKAGLVEVQDESAQLAAVLTDAKPGESVVDFCAGAGGKSLALAAQMNNTGRLIACDVSQGRLDRSAVRLRRSGVHNVTRRVLSNETDKWVKRHKNSYDRVLVDAPCSGAGTWRRNPDARWRLTEEGLTELVDLQQRILSSAARLVRPGGRLVYATCSLLPEENAEQVKAFLSTHSDFILVPVADAWPEGMTQMPSEFAEDDMLSLTPGRHGTDGFFIAVMQRRETEASSADVQVQKQPEKGDAP